MKKLGVGVLLALTLGVVLLAGNASAQNVGDKSVYFVTYYSNANTAGAPNAVLRLINDGDASTGAIGGRPNGNLWASIYVFDDSQEMLECCNCFISADGLLSEWVNRELTGNPLTGRIPSRGVIKIISSSTNDPTNNRLTAGIHGTMTHVQYNLPTNTANAKVATAYVLSEAPLSDANLVAAEKQALEQSCSFAITLGSGQGTCSCTPEDQDF
jgi:hypothetical protein